jgi:transposase IS116/IS110/IS902 family protein
MAKRATAKKVEKQPRALYKGPEIAPNKNPPPHHDDLFRLSRDLIAAAGTLGSDEARALVDLYYMIQENRKRAANQAFAMQKEPHVTLDWFARKFKTLEEVMAESLLSYAQAHDIGVWMMSITGIGPIITAGYLSHIDINKAPTAGHIWRFAGLDPSIVWEKGKIRPFNSRLKVLCWKTGQSFMKSCNKEDCFYGHIYKARKAYEIERNQRGDNIELAKAILEKKNFRKTTEAYKHLSGIAKQKPPKVDEETGEVLEVYAAPPAFPHLPPGQIDARSRRYAVKIFLSHAHVVWWWLEFKKLPPLPYAIGHMNHAHLILSPHFEQVPGLMDALDREGWLARAGGETD